MASINTYDSSQLLWIEIHGVTNTLADGEKEDKIKVSIVNSKGDGEMKSETVSEKKEGGKDEKKSESKSTQQRMRGLKEKCVAFSDDTIIVSHDTKFFSDVKAIFHRDPPKKSQDHTPPQKEEREKKFSVSSVIGKANGRQNFEYPLEDMNVTLHVTLKSLGTLSGSLVDDNKLGEEYDKLKDSSLSDGTLTALKDFASNLKENVELKVLDEVMEKVKSFAEAHPLIKIAVTALCIPYEMWKQEREFKEDLKALARDMCTSLEAMIEAYPSVESKHAKEIVTKLVRFILQASAYVESFSGKDEITEEKKYPRFGRIKQFIKAQFPKKLDDYRSKLRDSRLDFREAMLVDVLIKSGDMKDRGDMSFLRRKLKPSEQLPMDDEWLENSRAKVMTVVDTWLKSDEVPNVLWISGAPGAGKSAIASRIVLNRLWGPDFRETHSCATFFVKRGRAALEDSRAIWRSIAMDLIELSMSANGSWCRSLKIDILEVMSQSPPRRYPDNVPIKDQFRQLILNPLAKLFPKVHSSSRKLVVVIDALDECDIANQKEWRAFLDTIDEWHTKLPPSCKLIVTSRDESDIRKKLTAISHLLALDSGADVSEESSADIKRFFEEGFEMYEVKEEDIARLTEYAAGLFVWAKTVVDYVSTGHFKSRRLQEVLINMSAARDGTNEDRIGILYGQILFNVAWPGQGHPSELDTLSVLLASVTPGVLSRLLPLHALGSLSSPDDIKNFVDDLSSIILTKDDDEIPRVRHQSISDFLADRDRVDRVMKTLLRTRKKYISNHNDFDESESELFAIFSGEHQHAVVTRGCWHLMTSCAQSGDAFPKSDVSVALAYACAHWVDHLQGAGVGSKARANLRLVDPIKTFRDLQDRTFLWIEALCRSNSYNKEDNHLSALQIVLGGNTSTSSEKENLLLKEIERLANTHPIIQIILEVLDVAYKAREGLGDVTKGLAKDMLDSLMFMANVHPDSKQEYAERCVVELVKIVVKSSQYVINITPDNVNTCSKDAIDDIRENLFDYRSQMRNCRREAVLVHNLVNKGILRKQDDVESFLQRKLKPVKPALDDERCMEGTREAILSTVDDWLRSSERANVFWVSGAAGTGKTALASTVVQNLAEDHSYGFYKCAKYFIKERDVNLRDPRAIWRSVAYQLGILVREVKLDHLDFLADDNREAYPDGIEIKDQFLDLICVPLNKHFSPDSVSSRRIVVVIDALDECIDEDNRQAFLETIINWGKQLPWSCKLLVMSRREENIMATLKTISRTLVLDTGDIVSRESEADIRYFFQTKFREMDVDTIGWPNPAAIDKLTGYAGGVFVWATTVVEYIREDPVQNLNEVLSNMLENKLEDGEDKLRLANLYMRILLKDLIVLLTFGLSDSHLFDINAIFNSLASVIHIVKEGNNRFLRVRHRSFSEFLRNKSAFQTAVESIRRTISKHQLLLRLSVFSSGRQHMLLAEACLRLICSALKTRPDALLQNDIRAAIVYAYAHWLDHIREASFHIDRPSDLDIGTRFGNLIENFANEHILVWNELLNRTNPINNVFNALRKDVIQHRASLRSTDGSNSWVFNLIANKVDIKAFVVVSIVLNLFIEFLPSTDLKVIVNTLLSPYRISSKMHQKHNVDVTVIKGLVVELFASLETMAIAIPMRYNKGHAFLKAIIDVSTYLRDIVETVNGYRVEAAHQVPKVAIIDPKSFKTRFLNFREDVIRNLRRTKEELAFPAGKLKYSGADLSNRRGLAARTIYSCEREEGARLEVSLQIAFTGSSDVLLSQEADTLLSNLGVQGILRLMNVTLGTTRTLTPEMKELLQFCLDTFSDFGQAYALLRPRWDMHTSEALQDIEERRKEDQTRRARALEFDVVNDPYCPPRRLWDLKSNRVVPFWATCVSFVLHPNYLDGHPRWSAISHSWLREEMRHNIDSPINGHEWPIPIPKDASLERVRIEVLNLADADYVWLDILCLRQEGQAYDEDLRRNEWKLDVPTIGPMYDRADSTIYYFSGLGRPFEASGHDNLDPRYWKNRAWTLEETSGWSIIAGRAPHSPSMPDDITDMPIDDIVKPLHNVLTMSAHLNSRVRFQDTFVALGLMRHRTGTSELDKIAGLVFFFTRFRSPLPAYIVGEDIEDAWDRLVKATLPDRRTPLLFLFPEPGKGRYVWYPSWQQIEHMGSLPSASEGMHFVKEEVNFDGDDSDGTYSLDCLCLAHCRVAKLSEGGDRQREHSRRGDVTVTDMEGVTHNLSITAEHSTPIANGYYTLVGCSDFFGDPVPHWVVARRTESDFIEKVSVVEIENSEDLTILGKLARKSSVRLL